MSLLETLDVYCRTANSVSCWHNEGERATCILTSHALVGFLRQQCGLEAEPVRVEVVIYHEDRDVVWSCAVLGSSGDGVRMPATEAGKWRGHLAVWCQGYVLDPTIDQVEVGGCRVAPATFLAPEGWADSNYQGHWEGDYPEGSWVTGICHHWTEHPLTVRYGKYYQQKGWKSASDSRRSHWQPITNAMVDYLGHEMREAS
jgi:hypothetical protein